MAIKLDKLLEILDHVVVAGGGHTARCPAHDDQRNSLSITLGDDDRILMNCFAGCSIEAICAALDLPVGELFPSSSQEMASGAITIDMLAEDKKLPSDFLRDLGLQERSDGVVIPYRSLDGSRAGRHRLRTKLRAKDGSLWLFGKKKPVPYGLDRLAEARNVDYIVIVEGESDCWTLWHHGFPALGIPGSTMASKLEREHVIEIPRVYVVDEGDKAGSGFVRKILARLAKLRWDGSAFRLICAGSKDPNELHQQDPDQFKSVFQEALDKAEPLKTEPEVSIAPPKLDEDIGSLFKETGIGALTSTSTPKDIEIALRSLASQLKDADDLKEMLIRQAATAQLKASGIQAATKLVDAALRSRARETGRSNASGSTVLLQSPDPWPEPIDGPAMIDTIASTITRYIALPEHAAHAISLWILHCYAFEAAFVSPILAITSPEKRCGKTTLVEIIGALAPRVLMASNITPAALFRSIEKYQPILLIDEADTFLSKHDEMRGLLNAGHYRSTAQVIRSVGEDNEPRIFSTWCPKSIALIGKLKGTLEDRAIPISMRRRTPEEAIVPLRRDRIHDELSETRRRAARWVKDHLERIREVEPEAVPGLDDRAQDNWRPLLGIADVIGEGWPEKARATALGLSGGVDESDSTPAVQLLDDIRRLFIDRRETVLSSEELVDSLISKEDRPWGEWRRDKPLSKIQLARLLKRFGITPTQTHRNGERIRGYALNQFDDAFLRYLPPESGQSDNPSSFNGLDKNHESGQVGAAPSQVGAGCRSKPSCPESEPSCPDSIPTQLPFESGQQPPRGGVDDRDEFDL